VAIAQHTLKCGASSRPDTLLRTKSQASALIQNVQKLLVLMSNPGKYFLEFRESPVR